MKVVRIRSGLAAAFLLAMLLLPSRPASAAPMGGFAPMSRCGGCTEPKLECTPPEPPPYIDNVILPLPVELIGNALGQIYLGGGYYIQAIGPLGGSVYQPSGSGIDGPRRCTWVCRPMPASFCGFQNICQPLTASPLRVMEEGCQIDGEQTCSLDLGGGEPPASSKPIQPGVHPNCQVAASAGDFEALCAPADVAHMLENAVRLFGGSLWPAFCQGMATSANAPCIDNRICRGAALGGNECIECNASGDCFRAPESTEQRASAEAQPGVKPCVKADGTPCDPVAAPAPTAHAGIVTPSDNSPQAGSGTEPGDTGEDSETPASDSAHRNAQNPNTQHRQPRHRTAEAECSTEPGGACQAWDFGSLDPSGPGEQLKPKRITMRTPGRHATRGARAGDPVAIGSGQYVDSWVDLEIQTGFDLHFKLERRYSSAGISHGVLGRNFRHSYEDSLVPVTEYFPGVDDLPPYCRAAFPVIHCVAHYSGPSDYQIYVQDPTSKVFLPGPGTYAAVRQVFDDSLKTDKWLLRETDGTITAFDSRGRMRARRDRAGNSINLYYGPDDEGPLTKVVDPLQRSIDFTYYPNGLLQRVQDWTGRSVSYEYEDLIPHDQLSEAVAAQSGLTERRIPGFLREQHRLLSARLDGPVTPAAPARSSLWEYEWVPAPVAEANGFVLPEADPIPDDCSDTHRTFGESMYRELSIDHQLGNITTVRLNDVAILLNTYEPAITSPNFDRVIRQSYGRAAESPIVQATYEYYRAEDTMQPAPVPADVTGPWLNNGGTSSAVSCGAIALQFAGYPVLPREHGQRVAFPTQAIKPWSLYYDLTPLIAQLHALDGEVVCSPGQACSAFGARLDLLSSAVNQVCSWTRFVDQNGTTSWFGLNFMGQALVTGRQASAGEGPAFFTTVNRYNLHGELALTVSPAGRRLALGYDEMSLNPLSRGNLLSITETGSDMQSRQTLLSHEPLFNKVTRVEDVAMGRVSTFTYDYQELDATTGAATVLGYLQAFGADATTLSEIVPVAGLFFGADLNLDGRTSREAGDLIREALPAVSGPNPDLVRTHIHNEFGQLIQTRESGGRQTDYDYYAAVYPNGIAAGTPPMTETYLVNYNGLQRLARGTTGGYLRSIRRRLDQPASEPYLGGAAQIAARYFQYDAVGNVTTESNGYGSLLTTDYDGFGQPVQVTDEDGYRQTYDWDEAQNLVRIAEGIGVGAIVNNPARRQRRFYNAAGSLEGVCSELVLGACNSNLGSLIATRGSPTFTLVEYGYDMEERLTEVVDGDGHRHSILYNTRGLPITRALGSGSAMPEVEGYGYDADGNLVTTTSGNGMVTTLSRDGFGRVGFEQQPNGTQRHFEYNLADEVIVERVEDGVTSIDLERTDFDRDERGRIRAIRRRWSVPSGQLTPTGYQTELTTLIQRNAQGQPTQITDPQGNVTTIEYSSIGSEMKTTDGLGNRRYTYIDQPQRRLWHRELGEGRDKQGYQGFNRRGQIAVFNSSPWLTPATQELFVNDGLGNVTWHSNAQGNVELSTFDLLGRLKTHAVPRVEEQAADLVTNYSWNGRGLLTGIVDPMGVTTARSYFPTGRLASETSAGRITSYTWDLGGRLTGETHQGGERLAYGYVNDLLATVTAYDSSAAQVAQRSFTRDGLGRATSATHTAAGTTTTTTRKFDGLDNLVEETTQVGTLASRRVRYGHDRLQNVRSMEWPDLQLMSRDADLHGRITRVAWGTFEATASWEGASPTNLDVRRTGALVHQRVSSYDALGREIERSVGKAGIPAYFYEHRVNDALSRMRLERRTWNTGSSSGARSRVANYAGAGWLDKLREVPRTADYQYVTHNVEVDAYVAASMTDAVTTTLTRDDVGTLLGQRRGWAEQYTASKAVTSDHRLGTVTVNAKNVPVAYTPVGQLTVDGRSSFTWNPFGHLTRATRLSDGRRFDYAYDAFDRRVARFERKPDGTTVNTEVFVLDGWETLAVYRNNSLNRRVVPGMFLDQPLLIQSASSGPSYPYYDLLGNVAGTVVGNGGGNHGERYEYDVYGNAKVFNAAGTLLCDQATATTCNAAVEFGFNGQPRDPETGLYYYRNRYYSPRIRTFLSIDPAGFGDSFDPWQYVGGDPLNYVDPLGLRRGRGGIGGRGGCARLFCNGPDGGVDASIDPGPDLDPKTGQDYLDLAGEIMRRSLRDLPREVVDFVNPGATASPKSGCVDSPYAEPICPANQDGESDDDPMSIAQGVAGGSRARLGKQSAPKGSQNPKVSAAAREGTRRHTEKKYPRGFKKEVKLPSGKRMDAYNPTKKEVRELKPNNPRAIKRGEKQVQGYCEECDEEFGPGHSGRVVTYDPEKGPKE
ncbi:MAG: hypothetical protein IT370_29580 [Deltaproteobacteria bacterium]|nr:hypothetical protein [Deltaproteobacteria bacterium]